MSAHPTDNQVLELYERWTVTLATSHDFEALIPIMSRSYLREIEKREGDERRQFFFEAKSSMRQLTGSGRQGNRLIYQIQDKNQTIVSIPLVEEDGSIKFGPP